MNNATFNTYTPLQLLLLFIGITFLSGILFSFIGLRLAVLFFAISINDLAIQDFSHDATINANKLITLFTHIGAFILPSIILLKFTKQSFKELFVKHEFEFKSWWIILSLLLGVSLLSEWSLYLNQQIDFSFFSQQLADSIAVSQSERDATIHAFIGVSWKSFLSNTIIMVLIPAIGEELTFRGVLQPLLIRLSRKKHITIIFVGFLFAFIHFQFMDFIPRFVLGVIYGYVYFLSKNIFYTIILHLLNNFLALTIAFYCVKQELELPSEANGNLFILLLGIAFTFLGFHLLKQLPTKKGSN